MKSVIRAFVWNSLLAAVAAAQVPFATTPTWTSTYPGDYATGAGWADINRDGWDDLVTANGNDMARQRVVVYLSDRGTIPTTPNWQSADIDYNGHLSIADVNADGWPDVAVSVYIGPDGFSARGKVKLYLNTNGTLSATPTGSRATRCTPSAAHSVTPTTTATRTLRWQVGWDSRS